MQENKSDKTEEQSSTNINYFLNNFRTMSGIRKAGTIGIIILMAGVIFFVFFSNNSPSNNNRTNSDKLNNNKPTQSFNTQEIQSKNLYEKKAESAANLITKINTDITALKPPTPPVLEKPKVEAPAAPTMISPIKVEKHAEKAQLPIEVNSAKDSKPTGPTISATSVMAFGGGPDKVVDDKNTKKEEFLGFDGGIIENVNLKSTTATSVTATKINNDLKYTIVQGKIIDAVLETAINTQMSSGVIRAIISRDVYGEQGDLILIPKGSRLVGQYDSTSTTKTNNGVLTRVYAAWKRLITPNGVDINFPTEIPATDTLGRGGIAGYLDTNLSNNLMNAFLVSILGPYLVAEITGISKEQTGHTTVDDGKGNKTTTTTGSVGGQILSQGMQDFQGIAKDQLNKIYPPGITTIYIDQGTRIDVIVQNDIIFPKQAITPSTNNLP